MTGLTHKHVLPLAQVYGVLEPGPVVLVTTARASRTNIMTLTWHTMMEFEPPLIGCVISEQNHSFELLRETGECVFNVPTVELIEQVVGCGNTTGREVDKFQHFGLTPVPAAEVAAPLIAECYASLECRVVERRLVTKYNFFVLEVVHAWIDPRQKRPKTLHHQGEGIFQVAGRRIKRPSPKTSLLAE
jgi:flavin reductase (DIM6/NTAB) family NADH-FMN oxidoreductase RutF